MPSIDHESLVDMFRECPLLAADLLTEVLGLELPRWSRATSAASNLTRLAPTTFHADLVIRLELDDAPVFGLIVEPQTRRDAGKRYSWPVYAAALRARWRCPTAVLVVTLDRGVAQWAAEPIRLGGRSRFAPLVLGPDAVPWVRADDEARAHPERAVLSLLAHGHVLEAPGVLAHAIEAVASVDMDRARVYNELVLRTLDAVGRKVLEELMDAKRFEGFEFRSGWAEEHVERGIEKGIEKGIEQGIDQGLVRALSALLRLRFGQLPEDFEARVAAASTETLERWIERVLSATTLEDVFAEGEG